MKMAFVLLLGLIFCFCTGETVSSCTKYKAVGDDLVIELSDKELPAGHHLIWKLNQTWLYKKNARQAWVKTNSYGSLLLENLQFNQSGQYSGEVFDSNGMMIARTSEHLCVVEPMPEPSVAFRCEEQEVVLNCSVRRSTQTVVSWTKNGEFVSTDEVLRFSRSELKSGDTFSCTASDNLKSTSADVGPVCPDTGLHVTTGNENTADRDNNDTKQTDTASGKSFLFGLDMWWALVILTAGGSFLILLTVCVVCVCHWRTRSRRRAKKEEEYRLASLMPDYSNVPDLQYMQGSEPQRPTKAQRPLPPLPNRQDTADVDLQ